MVNYFIFKRLNMIKWHCFLFLCKIYLHLHYIYAFIQSDLQCIQSIHVFYHYVCPVHRTHDICVAQCFTRILSLTLFSYMWCIFFKLRLTCVYISLCCCHMIHSVPEKWAGLHPPSFSSSGQLTHFGQVRWVMRH